MLQSVCKRRHEKCLPRKAILHDLYFAEFTWDTYCLQEQYTSRQLLGKYRRGNSQNRKWRFFVSGSVGIRYRSLHYLPYLYIIYLVHTYLVQSI